MQRHGQTIWPHQKRAKPTAVQSMNSSTPLPLVPPDDSTQWYTRATVSRDKNLRRERDAVNVMQGDENDACCRMTRLKARQRYMCEAKCALINSLIHHHINTRVTFLPAAFLMVA